ncbi:hypothetical protein DPMN_030025 [Dreissena polymorpha]|uniref:Uncharacterized protein n=1 Tax=Dreissena polymorpha TaxID=45954 RepID=A0A9D4LXG0_DREPO|nr:hypothetical protein DPMN_030025 [Dreissena polymorpha]
MSYEEPSNTGNDGFFFVPKDRSPKGQREDQRLSMDEGRYGDRRDYDNIRDAGRPVFY